MMCGLEIASVVAIEVVEMRMLRFYLGVTRKGNTRNERTRGNIESGHAWKGQTVKAGMVRSSIPGAPAIHMLTTCTLKAI